MVENANFCVFLCQKKSVQRFFFEICLYLERLIDGIIFKFESAVLGLEHMYFFNEAISKKEVFHIKRNNARIMRDLYIVIEPS